MNRLAAALLWGIGWLQRRLIPRGIYCYGRKGRCPFWSINASMPPQDNGYCSYLCRGDWDIAGVSLLWDEVKECDVKMGYSKRAAILAWLSSLLYTGGRPHGLAKWLNDKAIEKEMKQ